MEEILTEEALEQKLSLDEWALIQRIHDNNFEPFYIDRLETLTGIEFPEFK